MSSIRIHVGKVEWQSTKAIPGPGQAAHAQPGHGLHTAWVEPWVWILKPALSTRVNCPAPGRGRAPPWKQFNGLKN